MADTTINRFSSVATDPLRSFRFIAEFLPPQQGSKVDKRITGFTGGFRSISGLGINTQSIAYREGGYNTTIHQVPGMTTFNPITMDRGVIFGNNQAIDWMRTLFAAAAGDGIALTSGNDFRCDIKIYVLDHPAASNATSTASGEGGANNPKMGFHVHNAWISTLNYSDLDAGGNNLMVETLGLVHEGLSVFFTDGNGGYAPVRPAAL